MWHLREPSPERIRAFLAGQEGAVFSYPAVAATRREPVAAPAGYDLDHNRARLGEGAEAFEAACGAVRRWVMFPAPWARIEPRIEPRIEGRGEERFSVELREDGTVWYDLLAFSTPRYWAARLGYPLARRLHRRFVRDSLAAMRRAVVAEAGGRWR